MSKPLRHGTCFIIHASGNRNCTWSRPFRFCGNAEKVYRQIQVDSPGLKDRLEITKYVDGKHHSTYSLEN